MKPICGDKLQIIYKNNKPHGVRDKGGFLFFFVAISKYEGQEERYQRELEQQCRLAEYLLNDLLYRRDEKKMREAIEGMLNISDLWLPKVADEEHRDEAHALHYARQKMLDAVK